MPENTIDFEIEGGHKLRGEITTNASKNGAVALIAAALINKSPTTLHGIPKIEEVDRLIEVLKSIGINIKWLDKDTLKITPPKNFKINKIHKETATRIRVSLYLIGALGKNIKTFKLPHSGGCKMGTRTISAHRYAFENLGLKIKTTETEYVISHKKLHASDITLYEASDGAAINTLLLASQIPNKTIIRFAPPNYQVQEVCFFLEKLGVKINGIGTTTLEVEGLSEINESIEYWNSEDPIESMLFISAAITTNSKLKIKRSPIDFLRLELLKLEKMGLKYKLSNEYLSLNNRTKLVDLEILPSKLKAPSDKIHALPYPGINTDNLPFFVPIATQTKGITLIHDWMWENRAIYFTELNKLGANVNLADPHRVYIEGPTELKGAEILCPPALRPAAIILVSMLAARGRSLLKNVYSISRGYENIAERLNSIGAKIKVLK